MGRTKSRVTSHLRELRLAKRDMTQADLASRVGVTRQTIIAIEQGRFSPTLETALRFEQVFEIPVSQIFELID